LAKCTSPALIALGAGNMKVMGYPILAVRPGGPLKEIMFTG